MQAAKLAGASYIYGIDVNPKKFELAKDWGCDECLNPKDFDKPIQQAREMQGSRIPRICTQFCRKARALLNPH